MMSAEDFYSDTKQVADVSREYNQNKQLLEDWKSATILDVSSKNNGIVKGDDEKC